MQPNEKLRGQIFEIINDQIKNNDPPQTTLTYNSLMVTKPAAPVYMNPDLRRVKCLKKHYLKV